MLRAMRGATRAYPSRRDCRAWVLALVFVIAMMVASHIFVGRGATIVQLAPRPSRSTLFASARVPAAPAVGERPLASPKQQPPQLEELFQERRPDQGRSQQESLLQLAELAPTSVNPWERPTMKPPIPRRSRQGEKFLAYLPHSGFHNQRIELENAILLAYYLKRTLVVPPCFLGPPMPWLRYDRLYSRLTLQTKHGLEHCPYLPPKVDDPLCVNYTQWTQVSWESVLNFNNLRPYVDLIHRNDVREVWLKERLNITPEDITFVKDRTLYEYRIYDSQEDHTQDTKYRTRLDVAELLKVESPLLHFGSLFGSGRVATETLEHSTFNQLVQSALVYSNPKLMAAAGRIVEKLGGPGTYLGLHLRVGDGVFRSRKPRYIRTAIGKLNKLLLREAGKTAQAATAPVPAPENGPLEGFDLHASFANGGRGLSLEECLSRADAAAGARGVGGSPEKSSPVLFLATDAPDPRRDPAFGILYNRWPCVFSLADFATDYNDVKHDVNDFDSTIMAEYLIPMLDSVVAAKGRLFVGTLGSTFSLFVGRLHQVYTNGFVDIQEHASDAVNPA